MQTKTLVGIVAAGVVLLAAILFAGPLLSTLEENPSAIEPIVWAFFVVAIPCVALFVMWRLGVFSGDVLRGAGPTSSAYDRVDSETAVRGRAVGYARWGIVLGIIAVVAAVVPVLPEAGQVFGILAIVLGIVSHSQGYRRAVLPIVLGACAIGIGWLVTFLYTAAKFLFF